MTRATQVLTDEDRIKDSWITIPWSPVLVIPARYGRHFRVVLAGNTILEAPTEGFPGQHIRLRLEQDQTGGWALTPNTASFVTHGSVVVPTAPGSAVELELACPDADDPTGLYDVWGVPDLSGVYDPAGAAASAQSAAEAFATAADATVLSTAEGYTDTSIAAVLALVNPSPAVYTGNAVVASNSVNVLSVSGGPFKLDLPPAPSDGDFVLIHLHLAATETGSIGRNGKLINNDTVDISKTAGGSIEDYGYELRYDSDTGSWWTF